jgi:CO/xanthine dehydrogenase Mo-binding subunit
MTENLDGHTLSRELSRRTFLKGGGALIVGFSSLGALAGKAQAADSPFASNAPYDPNSIDSWVTIHSDNTATIKTGRVELGQGTSNGLLMIAAEELSMDLSQMRWVNVDTNVTPDTGGTYGSSSIKTAGPQVRAGAAYARQALLGMAATQLGVPVASLTVDNGVVSGGGKTITYGALLGDKLFNSSLGARNLTQLQAPAKPAGQYKLVGTSPPRIDIPDKVTAAYTYVHSIRVPGMLHARLIRPRGQGAYGTGVQIESVDESTIKHIKGVRVLRKGNFLAVVAPEEYSAVQAAAQLRVKWVENPLLPSNGNFFKMMRDQDAAGKTTNTVAATGNPDAGFNSAAKVVSATYSYGYNSHAPMGPTCCVADVRSDGAVIYSNGQDSYVARPRVAAILGLPVNAVRFRYYEGGGSFGGHPARYDAPPAVALISQLAGAPVRLQYMRWDEHGWDAYGPSSLEDIRAGIDAKGKITAFETSRWSFPGAALAKLRETTEEQLGMTLTNAQIQGAIGGASIETSYYTIQNQRAISKAIPYNLGGYLKQAPIRETATAVFGVETMIDELAYAANMDPIEFRLQNMTQAANGRDMDPLVAIKQVANWETRPSASKLESGNVVHGRGVACTGKTGAVVADIEVNKKTGKITVQHMYGVQDVGLAISPGLVQNQMTGSLVQTVSRALLEGMTYNKNRVTGLDYATYPILRFKDAPNVTTVVLQRTDQVSSGAGEPLVPGTPPALANAFFDATGVRIRQWPLNPGHVRAALAAAGK